MGGVLTETFADNTAVVTTSKNPAAASAKLQVSLDQISNRLKVWRLTANETKSYHVTFTMRRGTCPQVTINNKQYPSLNQQNTWEYIWTDDSPGGRIYFPKGNLLGLPSVKRIDSMASNRIYHWKTTFESSLDIRYSTIGDNVKLKH